MKNIYLSVVIPAYKESKRIGATLLRVSEYLKTKDYSYEIIVVNDGSPDNQVEVIKNYLDKIDNLKLLSYTENRGKGYAVNTGMLYATGENRLFMDADNSVDISHLDKFLKQIESGYDVAIGSIELLEEGSVKKENNGFMRRFLGKLSKKPIEIFVIPGIKDTQRGFKLFTKRAVELIFNKQTIFRFAFDIELLVIAKVNYLKIKELPVIFDNPLGSTVSFYSYIDSLKDLGFIFWKKLTGVYDYPIIGQKKYGFVDSLLFKYVLMFAVAFVGTAYVFSNGIKLVGSKYDYLLSINNSNQSNLSVRPVTNSVEWVYNTVPLSKDEFGGLLLLALFFTILGADIIYGLVLERLFKTRVGLNFIKYKLIPFGMVVSFFFILNIATRVSTYASAKPATVQTSNSPGTKEVLVLSKL